MSAAVWLQKHIVFYGTLMQQKDVVLKESLNEDFMSHLLKQ